jgi:hypothetical protein
MMDRERTVWRKSTYSSSTNCVEVAVIDGQVAVRDSKNQQGPFLVFSPIEWRRFLDGVRDGQFDLPV